mgnify:FL=1
MAHLCHLYKLSSQNLFYEQPSRLFSLRTFLRLTSLKMRLSYKMHRKDHKIVFISHGMSGSTLIFIHQTCLCVVVIVWVCVSWHYIPVRWIHSSLCNSTISTVSLNLFGVIHSEAQDYHIAMTMMTLVKLNPLSDFEAVKCERVSASVGKN